MTGRPAVPIGLTTRVAIDEQSQIGAARRSAVAIGHEHNLGAEATGRLAIIVTEAATNVLLHGGGGSILLRAIPAGSTSLIEVLALDKGRGIPDIARAMRDGYSTSGTAGQGLGAMKRLAQVFAIYSQRDAGTVVVTRTGRLKPRDGTPGHGSLDEQIGAVCVPLRGEIECGDAWQIIALQKGMSLLLVDGLGHGAGAAAAAAAATTMFPRVATEAPHAALGDFNRVMRETRGAALSMAKMDESARTLQFAGVGNVDGRVLHNDTSEHLIPQNGIVGHTMPIMRSITASWPVGACLVMHSDGISARWRMDAYPGLMKLHPALLAGVIYRDFGRDRDDATVIVLRDIATRATEDAA